MYTPKKVLQYEKETKHLVPEWLIHQTLKQPAVLLYNSNSPHPPPDPLQRYTKALSISFVLFLPSFPLYVEAHLIICPLGHEELEFSISVDVP
jgi:hypothetical protein